MFLEHTLFNASFDHINLLQDDGLYWETDVPVFDGLDGYSFVCPRVNPGPEMPQAGRVMDPWTAKLAPSTASRAPGACPYRGWGVLREPRHPPSSNVGLEVLELLH